MEKFARFMEYFWLVLAAATAGWAVYITASRGWAVGQVWIWFPIVCLSMWAYRRFMRRKMAQWAERQQGPPGDQ